MNKLTKASRSAFARQLSRLIGETKATSAIELGLLLPVISLLLLGTIELGYKAYVQSVVDGVLQRAARAASIGGYSPSQIDTFIREQAAVLLGDQDTSTSVVVNRLSYYNFADLGGGEKIVGDTAPVGVYNIGDCYQDVNGNGVYDANATPGGSLGGADDIVFYEVLVTIDRLMPIDPFPMASVVRSTAVIRNQPYGAQTVTCRV